MMTCQHEMPGRCAAVTMRCARCAAQLTSSGMALTCAAASDLASDLLVGVVARVSLPVPPAPCSQRRMKAGGPKQRQNSK